MVLFYLSSPGVIFLASVLTVVVYNVALAIYRLYFHPLATFPGPRLAAATYGYQVYHDVIHHGMMIWHIEDLHKLYGPIVRFTPNEVHIQDPDFFLEIYNNKQKLSKPAKWNIVADHATVAAIDHERHRLLRSAMNPFFSKRNILSNEAQVQDKVNRLIRRLKECKAKDEIVRMDAAFMALTMDVMTTFAFNVDYEHLNKPDFNIGWKKATEGTLAAVTPLQLFPWLVHAVNNAPLWLVEKLDSNMGMVVRWQQHINEQVDDILKKNAAGKRVEGTIFQSILDSNLPPEEKRKQRLEQEGLVVVGAGSETTARALSILIYYLFSDPEKLKRLRGEIGTIQPEADGCYSLTKLEQLPYLTACLTEGLRYMSYAWGRVPRTSKEPVVYKEWTIPPGAIFSVNIMAVQMNESFFPKPLEFVPERWIEAKENDTKLERYFVAFGRGPRSCIGINLAWAELYLTVAHLVTAFDMELYDTTWERDVRIDHEFFVGMPSHETRGIRVKVVNEL